MEEKFFTTEEAASVLGVHSKKYALILLKRAGVTYKKMLGRIYLFDAEETRNLSRRVSKNGLPVGRPRKFTPVS
jgi:hypothetical protein